MVICPVCRGEGVIKEIKYTKTPEGKTKATSDIKRCHKCDGRGYLNSEPEQDKG